MKKNILITGGAGYIGSHTAQAFLDKGYNVTIFDNLSTGFMEAIPNGAEFIKGDIHDVTLLTNTMTKNKIDGVIHFAAKIVVPESLAEPLDYYNNNTVGVIQVLEACRKANVAKIVFSSTAAVYGNASDELVKENTPVEAINPYGSSKYFSECIIRDSEAAYGIKHVILRYFNVAGAAVSGKNGQRSKNATHLIKLAAETALNIRTQLSITGTDYKTPDGTGVRDYIHVEDLAEIHTLAFDHLDRGLESQTFNCGYGRGYSVRDVINTIKKVSGNDFKVIEAPRRPGDAASLVADNSKVKAILKWQPLKDDLELICRTAYEWERTWRQSL
jgi:UDP-glucose 4-epimerase